MRIITVLAAMGLIMALTVPSAMAQKKGNYSYQGNTQSRDAYYQMRDAFMNDTDPIRNEIDARLDQLAGMIYSPSPDEKKIKAQADAISALRTELFGKSVDFAVKAYQKTGIHTPLRMLMGHRGGPGSQSMMGPGMMQHGMMGGRQ